ncbi:MAG: fatty-acyl-CoA synthase [Alphaproteobacteria bacterium]|nr:MAG: fatty-acyl-CoA synthase [Caulobacteraceae bacterium]TPW02137.1 MAG: fatty-acyl-CoA synthase [Alphaproteobacteria bacterium]
MQGLMQDWPMTLDRVLTHARATSPAREIVTRSVEGPVVRTTYDQMWTRARQVSRALLEGGVELGDRIATLAWNSARHMEVWYGAMGIGAVLHTVNPRLLPEQIAWIINHAGDRMLAFDITFLPIVEKIAPLLETVTFYVILTDDAHMPQTALKNVMSYETWIAGRSTDVTWGGFDENTAAGLCYTSGTTGNPKGVLYSHRSNMLHAFAASMGDAFGLRAKDVVLPVVPMFHANAWAITFMAPMAGCKLVMPGAKLDGQSIYELLETEKVTFTAAVPTVWLMLLQHMRDNNLKLSTLKRVVIGGSAVPEAILRAFEEDYGVEVIHAWGMTEMSPMGTLCTMGPTEEALPHEDRIKLKLKQGKTPYTVEMKIVDDAGKDMPRDGKAFGRLLVRGPSVAKAYYKNDGAKNPDGTVTDADGWFDTGDVATIDPLGFMTITDRAKDVIKSGGEWISSIDIENIAVGAPGVANAAVIGVYHPKWDERPLLIIQKKPGEEPTKDAVLKFLEGKIAKWWTPDDVAFVDAIPLGATGKINKMALRETFKDYTLPTAG